MVTRKKTRVCKIGSVSVGGMNPIRVQSMCTTEPDNFESTIKQIRQLEAKNCEIIRVTVPNLKSAKIFRKIKDAAKVPIVADIHFNYRVALKVLEEGGADKVRINPGNIGGNDRYIQVIKKAKECGSSMRIGVNSGSLDKSILEKYGFPSAAALAESAMRFSDIAMENDFENFVVSIKSTDAYEAVTANRLFSAKNDSPLHLGITEAGAREYGTIKSAAGLGAMLLDGLGDTIRVSLSCDPIHEVDAAYDILKATRRRVTSPEIISCPTCGRIEIDLEKIVGEVKQRLVNCTKPIQIAILGCVVNGPGECAEADIGVAGGNGMGIIFKKGVEIARVKESEMVDFLIKEIDTIQVQPVEEAFA